LDLGCNGIFAVIMTSSFLAHEIAHKIMAKRMVCGQNFDNNVGSVLTLVSVFLPFKMISPGAMMLAVNQTEMNSQNFHCRPAINLIFSTTLLGVALALPTSLFASMLFFAAYINAFMAVFNLVPFGILDGYKFLALTRNFGL